MTNKVVSGIVWVVSVCSAATFGWGTLQQTNTQRDLNQTMVTIVDRMKTANTLLEQTNVIVKPLGDATADLVTLNQLLGDTVPKLQGMNSTLSLLAVDETNLVQNVGTFNSRLSDLIAGLNQTRAINGDLYTITSNVDTLSTSEAAYVNTIAGKTNASISQLALLNSKFRLLGKVNSAPGVSGVESTLQGALNGVQGVLNGVQGSVSGAVGGAVGGAAGGSVGSSPVTGGSSGGSPIPGLPTL